MDMGQPRLRQRAEVLHPIRFFDRERLIRAAQFLRYGQIADAEIADVQLVDHNIFRCLERRLRNEIPAFWF